MLPPQQVEELIALVSAMDREELTHRCMDFQGAFPVDFTSDFLDEMPIDRLRHIFIALCLHNSYIPADAATAA